ncbi:MAG: hypothetical protein ACE5JD_08365 [Candidatus Methylomirabilia bacterium]
MNRPLVITLLAGFLFASPLLQICAVIAPPPFRLLNFGPTPWLAYPAYLLVAPLVGALLWRGHPRARFAAYLFASLELLRGVRAGHWDAVAAALAVVALLQIPSARRFCPRLRPTEMRARFSRLRPW